MKSFFVVLFVLFTHNVFAQLEDGKNLFYQARFKESLQSLQKETNPTKKDEVIYWQGLCYDLLVKRDSSLLIYSSIKPSSPYYWKAQTRMSITYTFKANRILADSLLKSIESVPSNLAMPEYLQARWYYYFQGSDFPKALRFAIKNVNVCEQRKDNKLLALAYFDLGMTYSKMPNFKKSIEALEKAVEIQNKEGTKAYLFRTYQGLAAVYQGNDIFDKSDFYYKKMLEVNIEEVPNLQYYIWIGLTTNAIGRKKYVDAEKYVEKAKNTAKKYLDIQQVAFTHVLEANIKLPQKKYAESSFHFKAAIPIYQKVEDMVGIEWCANGLAKIYEQTGDYKQALQYRKMAYESNTALRASEKTKIMEDLNAKYEVEKKERLITSQRIEILEKEKKTSNLISLVLLVALLSIVLFALYRWQQNNKILRMQQQFKETTQQLESFNLTISHELRQPIVQMQHVLTKANKRLEVPEIQQIERSLEEMDALVQAMLQLSKIETESLHYGEVDTQELVKDILFELTLPSNLRITYQNLPTVRADVFFLRLVFTNLILNAIKFTANTPQPLITIQAASKNNQHLFLIVDNGIGFPPDRVSALFRLFGRLKNAASYSGFGVGLTIVKTIIEKHGGHVWAEGQEGKGATFGFGLPQ